MWIQLTCQATGPIMVNLDHVATIESNGGKGSKISMSSHIDHFFFCNEKYADLMDQVRRATSQTNFRG